MRGAWVSRYSLGRAKPLGGDQVGELALDLNKLLTAKELELYGQHMTAPDARGDVIVGPGATARRMLHALVTRDGRSNPSGGVHVGRESIVPLLIDALVGPDPDPEAWLEAIAAGSFDISIGKTDGSPVVANGAAQASPSLGSPGTYLPRLLERYERARQGSTSRKHSEAAHLRNALGILIATTLLLELKKATNARAALGSAWPLVHAVSSRPQAALRRALATFGADTKFVAHLATAIENAVAARVLRSGAKAGELSNKSVETKVPPGVDVTAILSRQRSAGEQREKELAKFGQLILVDGNAEDEVERRALDRLSDALADWRAISSAAMPPLGCYLDEEAAPLSAEEAQAHYRRLRFLMPVAASPSTMAQIQGYALGAARVIASDRQVELFGIAAADCVANRMASKVSRYVWKVGPPPPAVAMEHLRWFEASVCYHSLSTNWPAREKWWAAGLMPCEADTAAGDQVRNLMVNVDNYATLELDADFGD